MFCLVFDIIFAIDAGQYVRRRLNQMNMKQFHCLKILFIFIFLLRLNPAHGQLTMNYNLSEWLDEGKIENKPDQLRQLPDDIQKQAISAHGVSWLKGVEFKEGTIDIDLRGKDIFLQSFLGICFHGVDTTTYEVIYFRPFNFRHSDTLRRKWSVQYMSLPDYDYDKLRKAHPLAYENSVHPVPEAKDWFHATIVIKGDLIKVFVNHSAEPSLQVKRLNDVNTGKIGLWADGVFGDFANLAITQ